MNIVIDTNDKSLNMPSLPSIINDQVSHYYVDDGGVQENSTNNEILDQEDNVDEALL